MSVCCSYQVAIFQVALITLVRCAFLRNHTTCFCTVILGIFAYCDCAILRSMHSFRFSVYFRRNPRKNRKECFRFLPSKPEVIVPVWCNIEWINANFRKTFFSKKICSFSVIFALNIGFGRSPTSVFEVGFEKSDSKLVSWHQLALLAAVANSKIFVQKNNRPLQVELENGRSRLQNDFQIWEARWEVS